MAFDKWKNQNQPIVTVTVATLATLEQKIELKSDTDLSTVTKVTTVTVTEGENEKVFMSVSDGGFDSLSAIGGGDNSVNSANSLSDESANDDYETFVIKPVIQESVRQVDDGNNPKITARLEKEDNGLDLSRYAHLITCQQCEHLSLTGTCTLKGTQMYPDAKRDCTSFDALKSERTHIENTPYSHSQMQDFLAKYEKPLFYHLVDCVDCDFEAARYCHAIFKVGNGYDIMLSYFDDRLARREVLLAQVVKARISGRKLFVVACEGNVSPPC